jgi:Xaa-Pro aminopeptidase
MISAGERERRYAAVRSAMQAAGQAAWVVPGFGDPFRRGGVRYLSGWHLWAGTGYVVVPLDQDPVLIVGAASQAFWARTWSWLADVRQGGLEDVIAILRELKLDRGHIGVVGLGDVLSARDAATLAAGLPEAQCSDSTEAMDRIRLAKSPEEVVLMEETGHIVAEGIRRFREALAPGRTEREVVAKAHQAVRALGCLDGIAHLSTDAPPFIHPPNDRRFAADDIVKFSMEFAGPSGYWIELAGIFSFGEPPDHLRRRFETWQQAFRAAAAAMKPGVTAGQLVEEVEDTFRRQGQPVSGRGIWDAHSIGLDVLEPPIVNRRDDATVLQEGMVWCLHPGLLVGPEGWGVYIQENFVVTPAGGRPLSGLQHEWNVVA